MNQPTAIVIGLAVGIFARWLFLRKAPGGLPLALLLGTAGAMFTAFITQHFGVARDQAAWHFVFAVAGAGTLLLGYRLDLSREVNRPLFSSRDLTSPQ